MDGWVGEWVDGWMNGYVDGQMVGQMDKMTTQVHFSLFVNLFLLNTTRLGHRDEQVQSSLIMKLIVHQHKNGSLKTNKNVSLKKRNQNELLNNLTWLLSSIAYITGKMRKGKQPLLKMFWRPNRFQS